MMMMKARAKLEFGDRSIYPGEIVVLDPSLAPAPGNVVLVEGAGGDAKLAAFRSGDDPRAVMGVVTEKRVLF